MKPREKVVTAEDIQSSLYYVHVNQPEDAYLVDPPDPKGPDAANQNPASSNIASAPLVQRKAVPGTATAAPTRKPVPGTLAPVNNFPSSYNVNAGKFPQRPGTLAPDCNNPRHSFDSSQYQEENQRPPLPPRRRSENQPRETPSLTLIRRDPASGAQWNVARIEDPPVPEISSSVLKDSGSKKRLGAPMYVQVFNPGYSKFLYSDGPEKPTLISRDSGCSVPSQYREHVETPESQADRQMRNESIFRRRIWLEGSQHSGNAFGHRKNNSYGSNAAGMHVGQPDRFSVDVRPSPSPSFSTQEDQPYGSIQVSDRHTSFRGYVFTSPWNGRCEFVTGVGGGSLKVAKSTFAFVCQKY